VLPQVIASQPPRRTIRCPVCKCSVSKTPYRVAAAKAVQPAALESTCRDFDPEDPGLAKVLVDSAGFGFPSQVLRVFFCIAESSLYFDAKTRAVILPCLKIVLWQLIADSLMMFNTNDFIIHKGLLSN
jgi:hypothetical protein